MDQLVNIQARPVTLQYVQIQQKTREIDGEPTPQVGLLARPDLPNTIPNSFVMLEEQTLIYYQESADDDDDDDIDQFRLALNNLPQERKSIYDLLYSSPGLQREDSKLQTSVDGGQIAFCSRVAMVTPLAQ